MVFNQAEKQNGEQIMDLSFYALVGIILLVSFQIFLDK